VGFRRTAHAAQLAALALGFSFVGAMSYGALSQDAYRGKNIIFPDQGRSQEDRLRHDNASQGSAALCCDILLNLESAGKTEPFRADGTMRGYGRGIGRSEP
jgi:hypothetical protein